MFDGDEYEAYGHTYKNPAVVEGWEDTDDSA